MVGDDKEVRTEDTMWLEHGEGGAAGVKRRPEDSLWWALGSHQRSVSTDLVGEGLWQYATRELRRLGGKAETGGSPKGSTVHPGW